MTNHELFSPLRSRPSSWRRRRRRCRQWRRPLQWRRRLRHRPLYRRHRGISRCPTCMSICRTSHTWICTAGPSRSSSPASASASVSGKGPQSRDQLDNQYYQARNQIEQNQYERAIAGFDRVISGNGSQAAGAMVLEGLQPGPRRPPARGADDARRADQAVPQEPLDQGCPGAPARSQAGLRTVRRRRRAGRRRAEVAGAAGIDAERSGIGVAGDREDAERLEQRPRQGPRAVRRQP